MGKTWRRDEKKKVDKYKKWRNERQNKRRVIIDKEDNGSSSPYKKT